MNIDPNFGFPTESDVFDQISKTEQHIRVYTDKRRYGKIITLVSGFDKHADIKSISKKLKEKLACGGTVKDGVIELQGEHKRQVPAILINLGYSEESITLG